MAVLAVVAGIQVGGPQALMAELAAIEPDLSLLVPPDLRFGFAIYLAGMIFGGLGVIGQPHVLVRTMTLEDASRLARARVYYFAWLIPFYVMAIWVGLHARVILPELMGSATLSTEQALPLLGIELLPDVLVGLLLAGLFSATMSTADSQILACTTAVTQDLRPKWSDSYGMSKATTLVVTVIALTIALNSGSGVFRLVLDAWAVLSCSLGPLVIIRLLGLPCSERLGVGLVVVGLVVSNVWVASEWAGDTYVNFPGMAVVFATYAVGLGVRRWRTTWAARRGATRSA
jgi:sodium/proline symporter